MDLPDDIKAKAQDLVRDVTSYRADRVPCTFCGQWHGETGFIPLFNFFSGQRTLADRGYRIPYIPSPPPPPGYQNVPDENGEMITVPI